MAESSEVAANFGYTVAFFNSNPELKKLLARATENNYDAARFVAELQNTKWFRTTSESMRKYTALEKSDPATLKNQLDAAAAHIMNMGSQMGSAVPPSQVNSLAKQALQLGWSEDQLRRVMSGMVKASSEGRYGGSAGAAQTQFREIVKDYGINVSDATMGNWVKAAALGTLDAAGVRNQVQYMAASKYAGLKDRIMAGETVKQIADPYIQSYGKLLEVNPENISLDDPLLQRALTSKDQKGKPSTQTVWEFENTLRNDSRWSKTKNAQDLMSNTANEILKTFGVVS